MKNATATKLLTIAETLKAINKLNCIRGSYNSEYKEFRIRHTFRPGSDYFTNDRRDALMTAVKMSEGN